MKNHAFTLIELLVVILAIGILAAIALPQYYQAVGKAKFSELKILTKTVQEAVQRYYMFNNTYEGATGGLDITKPQGSSCMIWENNNMIRCCKDIFGTNVCYYVYIESGRSKSCIVFDTDKSSRANLLCRNETKKRGYYNCTTNVCEYFY